MSVIEGYFNDGQEFTKIGLIDENTYVKDKALLNIIQGLYDKQKSTWRKLQGQYSKKYV